MPRSKLSIPSRNYNIDDTIEVIDNLESLGTFVPYATGSMYKYLIGVINREFEAPKTLEDLKKIRDYTDMLINLHETGNIRRANNK